MAILPNTQDITQFLGSAVGKPVNFNPTQQNQGIMQPHPQQPINMPPNPWGAPNGPYNPYNSSPAAGGGGGGWGGLMGGPNAQGGINQQPGMPAGQIMRPQMPQMPQGGMPAGQIMQPGMGMQANPMMNGIFRSPMVR